MAIFWFVHELPRLFETIGSNGSLIYMFSKIQNLQLITKSNACTTFIWTYFRQVN